MDFLNECTKICSNDFELSLSLSTSYNLFENLEVAIIDKAVIVKPMVIDKNVAIVTNTSLFKLIFVLKMKLVVPTNTRNIIYLKIFNFYFGY